MFVSKNKFEDLVSFDKLIELGLFRKGTLYYFTSNNLIPFYKIGRRIFFDRNELNSWIESRKVTAS